MSFSSCIASAVTTLETWVLALTIGLYAVVGVGGRRRPSVRRQLIEVARGVVVAVASNRPLKNSCRN